MHAILLFQTIALTSSRHSITLKTEIFIVRNRSVNMRSALSGNYGKKYKIDRETLDKPRGSRTDVHFE